MREYLEGVCVAPWLPDAEETKAVGSTVRNEDKALNAPQRIRDIKSGRAYFSHGRGRHGPLEGLLNQTCLPPDKAYKAAEAVNEARKKLTASASIRTTAAADERMAAERPAVLEEPVRAQQT